jgi:hypothetical protein
MSGINLLAFKYSTFPPIKKIFLGDPGPLNIKNVFERLNNFTCNLIETRYQRSKKHNSG